jgi:hypothetical protein
LSEHPDPNATTAARNNPPIRPFTHTSPLRVARIDNRLDVYYMISEDEKDWVMRVNKARGSGGRPHSIRISKTSMLRDI